MGMTASRERDEELLAMIRLRTRGVSSTEIGRAFGLRETAVRTMTNRILQDDVKLSGEPKKEVMAAYWR